MSNLPEEIREKAVEAAYESHQKAIIPNGDFCDLCVNAALDYLESRIDQIQYTGIRMPTEFWKEQGIFTWKNEV